MRTALQALFIGVVATGLLLAAAYAFDVLGYRELSNLLFWQNELLQSLCPQVNIGTPENPVYEGTPLNLLAFIASFLGVLIYGVAAYAVLRNRRSGT